MAGDFVKTLKAISSMPKGSKMGALITCLKERDDTEFQEALTDAARNLSEYSSKERATALTAIAVDPNQTNAVRERALSLVQSTKPFLIKKSIGNLISLLKTDCSDRLKILSCKILATLHPPEVLRATPHLMDMIELKNEQRKYDYTVVMAAVEALKTIDHTLLSILDSGQIAQKERRNYETERNVINKGAVLD